jgi:predicted nuclease with TOPRIM domain
MGAMNRSYNPGGGAFGVDQALGLLRQVPLGGLNDHMVIDVIRKTLASAGIDLQALMDAAALRQDEVTGEIVRLQNEISTLHQAIEEKTAQVQRLQEQQEEIGSLRDRFER